MARVAPACRPCPFLPKPISKLGGVVRPTTIRLRENCSAAAPTLLAGESILWQQAKQACLPGLGHPAKNDIYQKPILDRLGLYVPLPASAFCTTAPAAARQVL
jgi:hypothetical protein